MSDPSRPPADDLIWHKALEPDELAEGRVKPVTCGLHHRLPDAPPRVRYAALDNRCPHQGGPLGEGSIENGWLRCPWHGWDYHPHDGQGARRLRRRRRRPIPLEVRDDGDLRRRSNRKRRRT